MPVLSEWLPSLVPLGGFGLVIALMLLHKLHSHGEYGALVADRDAWREVARAERDARSHAEQAAREALTGVQTLNSLLREVRDHQLGARP